MEQAISEYTSKVGNVDRQAEILEDVKLNTDTFLVFTQDESRESVYASLVREKWNGKWMVLDMSGNIPLEKHSGETNPYLWATITSDDISGYWGVIYDKDVEKIVLETESEEEAKIAEISNFPPIWYKVYSDSSFQLEGIEELKAIDSQGNEIPWSPHD